MKIHLICPVRNVTGDQQKEIDDYAHQLEGEGHIVHNPKYAVEQDDPTGLNICDGHLDSMILANRVDIFWDVNSKGSHFDLGMAFALQKPLKLVKTYQADIKDKSYVKVILEIEKKSEKMYELIYTLPDEISKYYIEKIEYIKKQKWTEAAISRDREITLQTQLEEAKKYFKL